MFDFDKIIQRENTCSVKWDNRQEVFGSDTVFPMWVADMDFEAPECITEAIRNRAMHGIYGYSLHTDAYFNAFADWAKRKQQWQVDREWCFFSPGIVPALGVAVQAFTKEWDKVLVQQPVYNPFFTVIEGNRRELVNSPLTIENGLFTMDFESIEKEFASGVKLMLLCSPHNPGGRVWTKEELTRLADLALHYKVIVVSDEIHGDLVYDEYRHIPFALLGDAYLPNIVVCQAPSKTFNIAGLSSSVIVIPSDSLRQTMKTLMETLHLCSGNIFGTEAFKTAYLKCGQWHSELMKYLTGNRNLVLDYFATELPEIHVMKPQAGFLAWIDFGALRMNDKELSRFFVEKAGVGLSTGITYGTEGSGYMRLNFGLNRTQLAENLEKIGKAIRTRL